MCQENLPNVPPQNSFRTAFLLQMLPSSRRIIKLSRPCHMAGTKGKRIFPGNHFHGNHKWVFPKIGVDTPKSSILIGCFIIWMDLPLPGFQWQIKVYIWLLNQKYGKPPQIIHLFIGCFIINHPFWGTPIFGSIQIPSAMTEWPKRKISSFNPGQLPSKFGGCSIAKLKKTTNHLHRI